MRLSHILFTQGFGTRRACENLIRAGRVTIDDAVCADDKLELDPKGLTFGVDDTLWPYHAQALILLNKPAGYECSHHPIHHPSVYSLLPAPLLGRGVETIGRLDTDTTGLLLLTDDGALLHRLTSPKHHVPKVYDVQCKHPVTEAQCARLVAGVALADNPKPVYAATCTQTGAHTLQLTLLEGKYHQVKRMIAAVSNRVLALHRSGFGALTLPADLKPGQWRWLQNPEDIEAKSGD